MICELCGNPLNGAPVWCRTCRALHGTPQSRVDSGRYYARATVDGPLLPAPTGRPDVIICRRAVDYAPAPIPATAAFDRCVNCGARIVYNPDGPYQAEGIPRRCMQCCRVQPLPLEPAAS